MKQVNKKWKIVSALACVVSLCVSIGVGAFNLKSVAAETITVAPEALVSVNNATAKHEVHSGADVAQQYEGLTVSSTTAYEGSFGGVFTGNTTIEYKFSGASTIDNAGDGLGDFYFRITSVADPAEWVQVNFETRYESSLLQKAFATQTCCFVTDPTSTAKGYGQTSKGGTAESTGHTTANVVAWANGGSFFHTDKTAGTDKLYIEMGADGLYLYYQLRTTGEKSVAIARFTGWNTTYGVKHDFSQGYTISFGSDYTPLERGKDGCVYRENATIQAAAAAVNATNDKGTDVCFVSLNGKPLTSNVSMESDNSYYTLNGDQLDANTEMKICQDSDAVIERAFSGELYNDGTGSYKASLNVFVQKLDTATVGAYTFTLGGDTYEYSVVKGVKGTDLIGVNVAAGATAEYKVHSDGVAQQYEGLTVSSATAYEGSFDGVFKGSTALEYKFPGASSVANAGDSLGDFYIKVTSVAEPTKWFQVNIGTRYNNANHTTAYEAETTCYVTNHLGDSYVTSINGTSFYTNNLKNNQVRKSTGSLFHSDKASGTDAFYFDLKEDGMYVYHKLRDGGEKSSVELGRFIGTNNYTPAIDFSQGYTISFGSDFQSLKYAGEGCVYDDATAAATMLETLGTDAGTDVCFISVNGVKLNNEDNIISFNDSVSYDGNVVEGQVDISAADADTKPFVVSTTASGEDYTVASVSYPLNYTKTAEVVWSKSNVLEDNTLVLQTGIFGNREVTVLTSSESGKTYTLVVNGVSTEVKTSDEAVALETQTMEGKAFIGWTISGLENKLYPANYNYTVVDGDVLTAVFVAFDMEDGAGIRKVEPYGLRFISSYNTTDFDAISAYASVGTLIVPTDMVGSKEINHENFTANVTMLDIAGELKLSAAAAEKALGDKYSEDNTYYTGTISDLKEANFARKFSARTYVKVTYADESEAYFYSVYDEDKNARSAYDVAKAVNEEGDAIETYINQTKDLTIDNVDTTVYESANKITSVRVNNVWISATQGAVVTVGETDYNVTYNYDEANAQLVLTFTEIGA